MPVTPRRPSTGEYRERGSRFLARLEPVDMEDTFRNLIREIAKEHHAARHVCWALRLPGRELCDNAREPSGSAGPPMLASLAARDVLNAGIVVVRYFGGVKLGVGNLSRAYRAACEAALNGVEFVPLTRMVPVHLLPAPDRIGEAFSLLERNRLPLVSQVYDPKPVLVTRIAPFRLESLMDQASESRIPVETGEEEWVRQDVS